MTVSTFLAFACPVKWRNLFMKLKKSFRQVLLWWKWLLAKKTTTLLVKLHMHVSKHGMSKHMRGNEAWTTVWYRNISYFLWVTLYYYKMNKMTNELRMWDCQCLRIQNSHKLMMWRNQEIVNCHEFILKYTSSSLFLNWVPHRIKLKVQNLLHTIIHVSLQNEVTDKCCMLIFCNIRLWSIILYITAKFYQNC